ncbi:MAG: DUF4394 domain-containing protein [Bryobacter sp.]|nr:DUF4394 domain-containing protein [Bryobacter sp.]
MKKTLFAFVMGMLALAPAAARAERAWAVDNKTVLVGFDTDRPMFLTDVLLVTGLRPGEQILGIDFRPATGKMYALGSTSRLYTLDLFTGAATVVGDGEAFTPALDGTEFGFDFNPTVDRIRIVSNTGQNLRAHPETGRVVAVDGALKYEDGSAPNVTAAAYTNSFAGATTTTLYNIDATKKALVTQAPPNDGVLGMIRPLVNMDFSQIAGFDISPVTNRGYLVMRETGSQRSMLYEIHFTTGDHNPLGVVDFFEQLGALAIEPANVQPF